MLAINEYRPLVELPGNSGQLKPLPVLSSYSGFVPNHIFNNRSPVEVMIYAVIQYLSFFDIKCSTSNIAKNLNASASTIRNGLNSLSKAQEVFRQKNGTFLFKNHRLSHSTTHLTARELSSRGLGYWLPVETLKSKKLTNQEKKAFALIKSLTSKKEMKIDMNYIAHKLSISRRAASPLIQRLLTEKLISRDRPYCRTAYTYQTGGQEMSIYKNDLPTGTPTKESKNEQLNQKCTQNFPSKCTQNFPSLSINKSNKYLIDRGKEQRASATYDSGQKKSLFFLEEIINFLLVEVQKIDEQKENGEDFQNLDAQYTQACVDGDFDKIQELRSRMAITDIRTNKKERKISDAEKTKAVLSDYEHCLKNARSAKIPYDQLKVIGEAVKRRVDVKSYETPKNRKQAFCLTFNSLVLDVSQQVHKSKDIETAIGICIKKLNKNNYELNYEIVPKNVQEIYTGKLSAANESYRNWVD